MNETWQGITQLMGIGVPNRIQQILAQAATPDFQPVQPGRAVESGVMCKNFQNLVRFIPNLLAALLTLLVGLLIAASPEPWCGILNRTNIDNRLLPG